MLLIYFILLIYLIYPGVEQKPPIFVQLRYVNLSGLAQFNDSTFVFV